MRARSGKQRFPVAQWVEDLEILQTTSIEKHAKCTKRHYRSSWRISCGSTLVPESIRKVSSSSNNSREQSRSRNSTVSVPPGRPITADMRLSGPRPGLDHVYSPTNPSSSQKMSDIEPDSDLDSRCGPLPAYLLADSRIVYSAVSDVDDLVPISGVVQEDYSVRLSPFGTPVHFAPSGTSTPVLGAGSEDGLLGRRDASSSMMTLVSVDGIVQESKHFNLQKVDPFFTDANNEYADRFEKKLADLNGKNSEDHLCIEEFLEKSEKDWFNRYRDVKLGKSPLPSPSPSVFRLKVRESDPPQTPPITGAPGAEPNAEQFLLPNDYVSPTGLKRFMLMKMGDWPVYSIFLAIVS